MDDDKGLDLSLGLPCGGSSSNSKDKCGNSADATKTDTDERTCKIVNDFKNFLSAGTGPVLGDKRKSILPEMNNKKKQETEACSPDLQDKGKASYMSITTDEGSTADNEDVAESEAEGSSSRTVSHCNGSRTPTDNGNSPQVPKEIHSKANVGTPLPVQPLNALNVPYSITIKESSSITPLNVSSYPRVSMIQSIPCTSGERPVLHSANPGSMPMTFGYSPIRVPMVDNNPWGMAARSQSIYSPYAVPTQVANFSSSEALRSDMRSTDQSKGPPKLLAAEESSSSHTEDDAKRQANDFPSEYPSIRPGIAPDVKFGGSGSFPNLPWVSTTGPNGKTISGVTYKYNATQVKIVCACHGMHMSPDEFIRHATEEQPNVVTTPNLASLPNDNSAAYAKS